MRLVFDGNAFDDLVWWVNNDPKTAKRIVSLIQEVKRDPFRGRGKPEALKHELSGCWSRRINQEHRLVYEPMKDQIRILSCRYHYDK